MTPMIPVEVTYRELEEGAALLEKYIDEGRALAAPERIAALRLQAALTPQLAEESEAQIAQLLFLLRVWEEALKGIEAELAARDAARQDAYLDSLELAPEGRGAFEPERVVPE